MRKRVLSIFLVVMMVLSIMPTEAIAATISYEKGDRTNATITVEDESGKRISGATVIVTRSSDTYTVQELGNGRYEFTKNTTSSIRSFYVQVRADGYNTKVITMRGNVSDQLITIEAIAQEIENFNIFYVANGQIPDNGYSGANDAAEYGPSANNTPLVTVSVNLTMLKKIAQQSNAPVVYIENSKAGNQWEFVPAGSHTDANFMDNVRKFWDAVVSCMAEESIEAFEETGLYDNFVGYCLKKQSDGSMHCDGVLDVSPPVYVVELYQNDVFFGGGVTDSAEGSTFLTAYDILEQYEAHLNKTITWAEDNKGKPALDENGYFTGTFIDHEKGRIHEIEIFQFDATNAMPVEGSEIPYSRQTDTYYLAKYNMSVDAGTPIQYTVTYTDGTDAEMIFTDHEYAASKGEKVPAYTGVTIREGYDFVGWALKGDTSNKIYSDAEIANMPVTGNMTFDAEWMIIPKYRGTVKFVLNGTYDATTDALMSGQLVDPDQLFNAENILQVYLLNEDSEYFLLAKDEVGIYSSELENGVYKIFFSYDGGNSFEEACHQTLTISNANRERYVFFNSVTYVPNGGVLDGTTSNKVEYCHSGDSMSVYGTEPSREGYLFDGWQDEDGKVYRAGDLLSPAIAKPYTLTALWKEATNVYVNVKINHEASEGRGLNNAESRHDIRFTIDSRADSSGNYKEIYRKEILWDGESVYDGEDYMYSYVNQNGEYTLYAALQPNLTNVRKDLEYVVTTAKSGYDVVSVVEEYDENGDLQIYLELIYEPNDFDFGFTVELDEEAKALPAARWPKAVNVKVTSYFDTPFDEDYGLPDGDSTKDWFTVTQQRYTYERVELDENGVGAGSYPVWMTTADENPENYYYRIEVVSYELQDGTIVPAIDVDGKHIEYDAEKNLYNAKIEVTGGQNPNPSDANELTGVWYENDAQQGTIKAIVSIPVFDVTFVPNGGLLNGSADNTVLTKLLFVPELFKYIPTRVGGFLFEGWFLAGLNGEMTNNTVESGETLVEDITLLAKWKDPIVVKGTIAVSGSYEIEKIDGSKEIHNINDTDRKKSARVLLQRQNASGYYVTIDETTIDLSYSNKNGVMVGEGDYAFETVVDDGSKYRIEVLTKSFSTTYQNEPNSVDLEKKEDYESYTATDFEALLGEENKSEAIVNAYMEFTPSVFDLLFEVNATAISKKYRPTKADVLVTYDNDTGEVAPEKWPVISQMILGDETQGYTVTLSDGTGSGNISVWQSSVDGSAIREYGLKLKSTADGKVVTPFEKNPYFDVVYQVPAYYDAQTGKQSQKLVATLVPKTYRIKYEPNGGTLFGVHGHEHVWSHDTKLTEVVPTREGYEFRGWYMDEALTIPLESDVIDASVAEDITFYAKWQQVNDHVHLEVVIDNVAETGGKNIDYERILSTQLTRRMRGDDSADFIPVDGQTKEFSNEYWHTRGDGVDEDVMDIPFVYTHLSSEYDYSVDVKLDGYYVDPTQTYVEKEVNEDGSTTHNVTVYLKFCPDMYDLSFSIEMADGVDKALYPVSADVKVTCWYNDVVSDAGHGWHYISQHVSNVVEVPMDSENGVGIGYGSYPVWQWCSEEYAVPYYYRVEIVALKLSNGRLISLNEEKAEEVYSGGGYKATLFAENGCEQPKNVDAEGNITAADTSLLGAFGSAKLNGDGTTAVDQNGATVYEQNGTLKAVIDVGKVVFHANNKEASCYDPETGDDSFRTYFPTGVALPKGEYYNVEDDGSVKSFYDIPEFDYETHNKYIFKGWYSAADETGEPIDWNSLKISDNGEDVHVYAHWIEVGSVAKEEADTKETGSDTYAGFDLIGAQIRDKDADELEHYGDVASGLRFITVLSEDVYSQINEVNGGAEAEYGFVLAKADTAKKYAGDIDGYTMQYKGANVNGADTSKDYKYVQNMKCNGVADHYAGEAYRLYTAVVTYNNLTGDALEAAYATPFVARSYIRYRDINGLSRTYYNNYTGTPFYAGCTTSFADIRGVMEAQ